MSGGKLPRKLRYDTSAFLKMPSFFARSAKKLGTTLRGILHHGAAPAVGQDGGARDETRQRASQERAQRPNLGRRTDPAHRVHPLNLRALRRRVGETPEP